MVFPYPRTFMFAACPRQRDERRQCRMKEPARPDTFAAAKFSYPVHPVVPVACPHQGKAMNPDGKTVVQRAGAVLEQGTTLRRKRRHCKAVMLTERQRRCFKKRNVLVQNGCASPEVVT